MILVEDSVIEYAKKFYEERGIDNTPIRVYLTYGWSGPRVALALDGLTENDEVYNYDGVDFIIEKELSAKLGKILIDLGEFGFNVAYETILESDKGCGSCGDGCGSCSSEEK